MLILYRSVRNMSKGRMEPRSETSNWYALCCIIPMRSGVEKPMDEARTNGSIPRDSYHLACREILNAIPRENTPTVLRHHALPEMHVKVGKHKKEDEVSHLGLF